MTKKIAFVVGMLFLITSSIFSQSNTNKWENFTDLKNVRAIAVSRLSDGMLKLLLQKAFRLLFPTVKALRVPHQACWFAVLISTGRPFLHVALFAGGLVQTIEINRDHLPRLLFARLAYQ